MIAVSALLVLIALVALIVRLVGATVDPGFETIGTILTYASIVLCVVAAILLIAGYLSGRKSGRKRSGRKKTARRRSDKSGRTAGAGRKARSGAPRSGGGGGREPDGRRKAPTRKAAKAGVGRAAAASGGLDVLDDGEVPADDGVVVVPGRLRYHLPSCRQVSGRDTEELTVAEAHEQGYVACTACRPDSVLAARAEAADAEDAAAEETATETATEPAAEETAAESAEVLVVSGQKRYHVGGCQVVADARDDGTEVTETTLADAVAEGLTPCRVCAAPTAGADTDAD